MRKSNQPLEYPSAGSVFKRPEGGYASLMIKNSNLMGEHVGDAEVSTKHAGFVVNKKDAKTLHIIVKHFTISTINYLYRHHIYFII